MAEGSVKIKKGDKVEVISGDDRGLSGTVHQVMPGEDRVIVRGINIIKKHQRAMPTGGRRRAQGGIIQMEAPIHISNVMLICPICGQRTRVGYDFLGSGEKVRVCKKCGATID